MSFVAFSRAVRSGGLWSTEPLRVSALRVSLRKLALRTKSTLVFARHLLREEIGAGTTAIRPSATITVPFGDRAPSTLSGRQTLEQPLRLRRPRGSA